MSRVELTGITRTFTKGGVPAVDDVSLAVDDGEFLVVLGPSGCGKTTLLRCLAGLERPDLGRIEIGGTTVFDAEGPVEVPPHRRDIGMVFQNYSLWPHMTVSQNVSYPLASRRVPKSEQSTRTRAALQLVECAELAERLPAALSGGQQQRIALARAVVAEPTLMLFDEPLSNLDYRLRAQLREEIRDVHKRLGFTALYVTHDQTEALQLGSRVVVMKLGRIEQIGTPEEVFSAPASPYVADFLGIKNRVTLRRAAGISSFGPQGLPVDWLPGATADGEYELYIRSSGIKLYPETGHAASEHDLRLPGCVVVDVLYGGERSEWILDVGGARLHASAPTHAWRFGPGDRVDAGIAPDSVLMYDSDEGLVRSAMTAAAVRV